MRNQGFSLVEMSVVLLIIALIVAGVSAGSELIRQANIRTVISDFNNYKTAYDNFFQRFQGVPGDFNRAETYWANGASGCSSGANNCNGNGDGRIAYSTTDAGGGTSEVRLAWRHLYMAEMVLGAVPQVTTNTYSGSTFLIGSTMQKSSVDNGGYFISGVSPAGRVVNNITSPWSSTVTKNSIYFGAQSAATGDTNGGLSAGVFDPRDAYAIDEKIDDGLVASGSFTGATTGIIRVFNGVNIPATAQNCISGSSYQVTNSTASRFPGCVVGMQLN